GITGESRLNGGCAPYEKMATFRRKIGAGIPPLWRPAACPWLTPRLSPSSPGPRRSSTKNPVGARAGVTGGVVPLPFPTFLILLRHQDGDDGFAPVPRAADG